MGNARGCVRKDRQPIEISGTSQKAHRAGISVRCGLFCIVEKRRISRIGTYFRAPLYLVVINRKRDMLVERGLQVMNVEAVGEAYAIASNYLRRTGAIADTLATNERLLRIIVRMFQRGEFNKIRLANKAIAQFEAETLITT
jgi:hypothetical protein